jgi:hypothetical protein
LTSDTTGKWREAATDLTKDVMEQLKGIGRDVGSEEEDALGPLRRALGRIANLSEAVAQAVPEPEEGGLRDLGRKLGVAKKELVALSRDPMISQPPALAAEAHALASEAEEAIRAGQKVIKAALRGLGVASDISEAGSLDIVPPPRRPTVGNLMAPPPLVQAGPAGTTSSEVGSEVAVLVRSLAGAQADDSGWPMFSPKYVEYSRFRKEWWAYRHTYHSHVRDELVCCSLKEKCLASSVRILVNDIEELKEAWDTLDTCFNRPEKYILEALDPITKFKGYKAFDSSAIREFYSLLRAAMMGARKSGLLRRLINDQTLPGILARMPASNCRQWAQERPIWIGNVVEEAFWAFVDQKWKDALNVAAAKPSGWSLGGGGTRPQGTDKKGQVEAKKLSTAAIYAATTKDKPPQPGGEAKRCTFADVLGCPRQHAQWGCGAFGSIRAEERARIIEDNRLCAFCQLHDRAEACRTKTNKSKPACDVPKCKGRQDIWLHELLKDISGKEGQVHVVQGETGWRTPEEAWMEDEREEEEEVML